MPRGVTSLIYPPGLFVSQTRPHIFFIEKLFSDKLFVWSFLIFPPWLANVRGNSSSKIEMRVGGTSWKCFRPTWHRNTYASPSEPCTEFRAGASGIGGTPLGSRCIPGDPAALREFRRHHQVRLGKEPWVEVVGWRTVGRVLFSYRERA